MVGFLRVVIMYKIFQELGGVLGVDSLLCEKKHLCVFFTSEKCV